MQFKNKPLTLIPTLSLLLMPLLLILTATAISLPITPRHPPIPYTTAHIIDANYPGAQAAHPADIDGDGDLDILGAARDATSLTWWENTDGSGTNWSEHTITANLSGAIIALGFDIDKDGDNDVLGAGFNAGDVAWWENTNGDGLTWDRHDIDLNVNGVYDIYAADLDNDGDLDVTGAASGSNEVLWWQNINGDGLTWNRTVVAANFNFASSVHTADINSDGSLDIIAAAGIADAVTWWENNNGSWTEHNVATNVDFAHWVHADDVDNDGDLDILATALNDNEIAWWENIDGTGLTWNKESIDNTFTGAHSVTTADLDNDGDKDILGAALTADQITWWENHNNQTWQPHIITNTFDEAHSVAAADLDQDGDLDILGAARTANDIIWWENETIHRQANYPHMISLTSGTFTGAFGIQAADINQDGATDIIGVAANAGQVAWWENIDGTGTVWSSTIIDNSFAGARALESNDIDGDGSPDIVGAAVFDNDITWWRNDTGDGSTWTEYTIDSNFTGAFWVHSADIDGDGDKDVLGAGSGNNTIAWWENLNSDGTTWAEHTITTTLPLPVGIYTSDIDNDGDLDVISAAFGAFPSGLNGRIQWWENLNSDGLTWMAHSVDPDYKGAVGVYATDIDQDGDTDILGAANVDQEFTWWENLNGNGTNWTRHPVGTGFGNAESVFGADLDHDGDTDIIGGAQNDNTVAWWENQAPLWIEHIITESLAEAVFVYAADINGDGSQDILAAAAVGNDLVWWPNRGGQMSLTTQSIAPTTIIAGQETELLEIIATHNGRIGDHTAQLSQLNLHLTTPQSAPLTISQINSLVESLTTYLDDGSGQFEATQDTLITATHTITTGTISLSFADGHSTTQIEAESSATYFIALTSTPNAHQQTNNPFHLTHIPTTTLIEDSLADIPLTLTPATTSTAVIHITEPQIADLALVKAVTPATAAPGQRITYTLTFSNSGNISSTNVVITDILSTKLTNVTIASDITITATSSISYIWQLPTLTPDSNGRITLTAHIHPEAASPATLTNTAHIAGTSDTQQQNNQSSASISITSRYSTYLPLLLK